MSTFTLTSDWIKIADTRPGDPLADFAYWTGLTMGGCKEGFKRVEDPVCTIDVPGSSEIYYDTWSSVQVAVIPKVAILPKLDVLG